jgi:hypothetical protein
MDGRRAADGATARELRRLTSLSTPNGIYGADKLTLSSVLSGALSTPVSASTRTDCPIQSCAGTTDWQIWRARQRTLSGGRVGWSVLAERDPRRAVVVASHMDHALAPDLSETTLQGRWGHR